MAMARLYIHIKLSKALLILTIVEKIKYFRWKS